MADWQAQAEFCPECLSDSTRSDGTGRLAHERGCSRAIDHPHEETR